MINIKGNKCIGIVLLFLIGHCASLFCQICDGNKGINIFLDGDFGSGNANVLQSNPNIAPGYRYTNQLPNDGDYSITKNTGSWNLYSSWLSIKDNSNDPNGYMMVVNASFSPGIFYEKTVDNICSNTLYEFSADVINLIKSGTANHIDPVVEFLIDGAVRFSTGNIPKNQKWNTYGFTFTAPENASSVKLTLRNNAPGGFGNDLALDNISFRACGPSAFLGIDPSKVTLLCIDDAPFSIQADVAGIENPKILWQKSYDNYLWQDFGVRDVPTIIHNEFSVGDYYYRYLTATDESSISNEKCRVISDVVHVKVLPLEYNVKDSICDNQFYMLGDTKINIPGNYTATLMSSRGCDSIVYLDLKVIKPDVAYVRYDDACDHGIEISAVNFRPIYTIQVNNDIDLINLTSLPYRLRLPAGSMNDIVFGNTDGCAYNFNIDIEEEQGIDISLKANLLSTNIYSLSVLSNVPLTSITWSTSASSTCIMCDSTIVKIEQDETVMAHVTMANGCEFDREIDITYRELPTAIFPNIFSPNGDGINDVFMATYPDNNIFYSNFRIYDRWGNLVFESLKGQTNTLEDGWNGKWKGNLVGEGVFIFEVSLSNILNETLGNYHGSVTVIK